jgi:hypothetical protein
LAKKIQDERCPKPPCHDSSPVNNNKDNHMKIEIDCLKCCHIPDCPCETEELIKNGGFEILSVDQVQEFAHWRAVNPLSNTIVSQAPTDMVPVQYEGVRAAWFRTEASDLEQHSISLQQNVTVTPGCIYQLSFAENLLAGDVGSFPSLVGRVFYTDSAGSQFDLIKIPIATSGVFENKVDKGYSFHQTTADIPTPCDVSKVTVQFDFSVRDTGGTIWLLDGVSLKAVSSASSCSRDGCASSGDICKTRNLVRNGGFEDISGLPSLYWRQIPETGTLASVLGYSTAYEGTFSVLFVSIETASATFKSVSLRQIVPVTPGCRLEFSFAENFLNRGDSAGDTPRLIGRVFWVNDSGNEFDLINIPIAKIGGENDVDKGFSFHKRIADVPVPCNVTNVYVQFDFSVTDLENTQWILDAVQLRSVPWAPACMDFKGVS